MSSGKVGVCEGLAQCVVAGLRICDELSEVLKVTKMDLGYLDSSQDPLNIRCRNSLYTYIHPKGAPSFENKPYSFNRRISEGPTSPNNEDPIAII